MTVEQAAYDKAQINRALEASIHIGLAFLLVAACLMILLPFIPLIAWGIIIAVAAYPTFESCRDSWEGVASWLLSCIPLSFWPC